MRIRVLGPLEVFDGDTWRPLASAKQRVLLSVLAVSANRVVSIDRLVEELWGVRPPASAINLVQVYVARLRRALQDRDGRLLRTQAPGYRLVVAAEDLDLLCFESLADRGMAALRDGASPTAADLLAEALALWRGPAFCSASGSTALETEANRLEQLRLAALEARIDADLMLGRHQSLAVELQALTQAHPLRERPWSQLMLALYRCGRQAEALDAYQRLYRMLDEELGVEPSQPVRELHQQILTNDHRLETSSTKPETAGEVPPRQLPADLRDFVGRQEHVAQLEALVAGGDDKPAAVTITAVSGTAGIGKTALAVHWAHQVADRFPDGQLYVNLRGFDPSDRVMAPAEAIRGFLDAFGVAPDRIPADLDAQAGLYRSQLAGKRVLVVLDNARDTDQLRPLLPGSPGCLVIATSRNDLAGLVAKEGARPLTVDLLTTAEARQLLARRVGSDRVSAEPEAVEQIIAACTRLPLALAIVAARAVTRPTFSLHALAAELHDTQTRLDVLASTDEHVDIRAVFSWSYQQLNPEAQRLFRRLGLHPGPDITVPAAASLAGLPTQQARVLLAELTSMHLAQEHTPGRYTLHDLLRIYATELVQAWNSDAERSAVKRRIVDHYLQTACSAAMLLQPAAEVPFACPAAQPGVVPEVLHGYQQAMTWFECEHAVLLRVFEHAAAESLDTHTWLLAWAIRPFLSLRGHPHDILATQTTALAAARRQGDRCWRGQSDAHQHLSLAYSKLGHQEEAVAHLESALDICRAFDDQHGQASVHRFFGVLLERQQKYDQSLDHSWQALTLYRAAGDPTGEASALNNVGLYSARVGNHADALSYCQQALATFQELGRPNGEATAWDSVGYAHHHLGQYDQALECYDHALELRRKLGNRYGQAETLAHIADTRHALGHHSAARQSWRDALDILEDVDHPDADQIRATLEHLESA